MTAHELSLLVLRVLDAQKTYFRTRDREDLIASKKLETELRKAAEKVIRLGLLR